MPLPVSGAGPNTGGVGAFPAEAEPAVPAVPPGQGAQLSMEWTPRVPLVRSVEPVDARPILSAQPPLLASVPLGPGVVVFGREALRPVFLTPEGQVTLNPEGLPPTNWVDRGEALFRLAEEISDGPSPFKGTPLKQRENIFVALKETADKVGSNQPTPKGLTVDQMRQVRSSSATLLLDLVENTPEPVLQENLLAQYWALAQQEPSKLLVESMAYNLGRSEAAQKKGPVRELAFWLKNKHLQVSPAYDTIFANGNKTVNMAWSIGGKEFMNGFSTVLEQNRFKKVGVDAKGDDIFERKYKEDGLETFFRITLRESMDILGPMATKDVHLVGYEGHSDFGRVLLRSLLSAPDSPEGGKGMIVFFNLCSGKAALEQLRTKYPHASIITTVGTSEFNIDKDSHQFTRSEGLNALYALMEGMAQRQDWAAIQERIDDADSFHYRPHSNFVGPASLDERAKFLDGDRDGKADIYDKHFQVTPLHVEAFSRRELVPLVSGRRADQLGGKTLLVAASAVNMASEMNSLFEKLNAESDVVPGGWFEPQGDADPIVRFTVDTQRKDAKGKVRPSFVMRVNAHYAHMQEETLRALAVFEFSRFVATRPEANGIAKADVLLMGLIATALLLEKDMSTGVDETWNALLTRFQLPQALGLFDFKAALTHHQSKFYAGDETTLAYLKQRLDPQVVQRLSEPQAGTLTPLAPAHRTPREP